MALDVDGVDVAQDGLLEVTERVQGPRVDLIDLQTAIFFRILGGLGIVPTPDERARILSQRTNDMLDGYRMLMETLGDGGARPAGHDRPSIEKRDSHGLPWPMSARAAHADDGDDEQAIRLVLARYARALAARDLATLATLQTATTPAQRAALERYFSHAEALDVRFTVVEILIEGDQALATYTREDRFTDTRSARPMELKVRISSRLAKRDGVWRLRLD
jgi:ketosteroid isomerase-like protein